MRRFPAGRRLAGAVVAASLLPWAAACAGEPAGTPTTSAAPDTTAVPSTTDPAASAPPSESPEPVETAEPGAFADAPLRLEPVAEVPGAIALASRPGNADLYVAGREGRVWLVGRSGDAGAGTEAWQAPDEVLDISDEVSTGGERGLLGIAFSADGSTLFVSYTDRAGSSRLEALSMRGTVPDVASRRLLLSVDQPFANHNGGHVAVGPDGYLWLGLGDGGGSGDPDDNAQDRHELLGSLLRVDAEPPPGGAPYAIPADNPYADGAAGAPEVWLWGVRNPWRFSFDRATGDLWLADVGETRWEEINVLRAEAGGPGRGANLGWDRVEGREPFRGAEEPADHHRPVFVYGQDGGRCSVIGGVVYRGTLVPALAGVYVFGDLCTGELRGLRAGPGGVLEAGLTVSADAGALVSFGEDAGGELYVLELTGRVARVMPAG